ncbi:MAG: hypothetical protein AAFU65_05670, partial [Pseudomonadota bacterium]
DLNNDGIVNVIDLGILRTVFFSNDPDADFNGDGVVNFVDLGIMRSRFFQPPGPAGLIIWVSLTDGDWANRLNWEPQIVPAQGSAALIDVEPAVVVTSSADTTLTGNIVNNETLVYSGGTLEVSKGINSSGPITFTSTAVNRTPFSASEAGAGTITVNGTNAWNTVELALDTTINNAASINAADRLTVNSTVTIVAPTSPTGLVSTNDMTLDGTGTIVFDSAGNGVVSEPRILPGNATTMTIGPDLTITGTKGTVGNVSADLVFNGTLDANVGGETQELRASTLTGNPTVLARNGAVVNIDADMNNPGGALSLDGTDGLIQFLNSTAFRDTTVNMVGATNVQIPVSAIVTMENAVINGDMTQLNASSINVIDGMTLNGTSTIVAPNSPTGYVFLTDVLMDGAANFVIDGTGNGVQSEPRILPGNGTTATFAPTVTISGGNGTIGNVSAGMIFQGTLQADVDGEELAIGAGSWSATGTLSAINNGALRFFGSMNNAGQAVTVDTAGGSLLWTSGGQFNQAVLNGTMGSTLVVPTGSYTMTSDVMNLDMSILNAANINVISGLELNSSLLITAPNSPTGLVFVDTQTLSGTGSIRLDGTDNGVQSETRLLPSNGTVLTVGAGIDVLGGNAAIGSVSAGLVFLGTLQADVDGQELAIGGNNWSANNAMSATNGGGIRFFGPMNNASATLNLDTADGFFNWTSGGQINAATLTGTPGTALRVPSGTYFTNSSVLNIDMNLENAANVNVTTSLTFNGDMLIDAPISPTGLVFAGDPTQTLNGTGTITFDGVGNTVISEPRILPGNGTQLIVGPDITIRGGKGQIGNASAALVFDGTLISDVAGEELRIGGSTWSASQTLQATNGGTISMFGIHDNANGSFVMDSPTANVVLLSGGRLVNTTVNGTAGTTIAPLGSTIFDNAVLTANVQVNNASNVAVNNGLTINGTAEINSTVSPTGFQLNGTQSVLGNLTVVFDGTANSVITEPQFLPGNGSILTVGPNVRFEGGKGVIGNANATLILDGSEVDANVAGEALRVIGLSWSASNALRASNGGILELGGTLNNGGGAFTLDAATGSVRTVGGVNFNDAVIDGTPGTVTTIAGTSNFENLTYTGDMVLNNAVNVNVDTDLTINGTVTNDAGGTLSTTGDLRINGVLSNNLGDVSIDLGRTVVSGQAMNEGTLTVASDGVLVADQDG